MKQVCYAVMLQSQLGPRAGELMLQEDIPRWFPATSAFLGAAAVFPEVC